MSEREITPFSTEMIRSYIVEAVAENWHEFIPGYSYKPAKGKLRDRVMREAGAKFDAWLQEVRADAWDEGEADGRTNEHEFRPGRKITNPYRDDDA